MHVCVLGLLLNAGFFDVVFELLGQVAEFFAEAFVLLPEFLHDVVVLLG